MSPFQSFAEGAASIVRGFFSLVAFAWRDGGGSTSRPSASAAAGATSSPVPAGGAGASKSTGRAVASPYALALTYLGTAEWAKGENPVVLGWLRRLAAWVKNDETPWCSAFVDAMCARTGYEQTRSLRARSWLRAGKDVPLAACRPGVDIVVLWRGSPDSAQGHVGFFHGFRDGQVEILGGNQGNEVSIARFPASKVLGCRRLRRLPSARDT